MKFTVSLFENCVSGGGAVNKKNDHSSDTKRENDNT